MFAKLKLSLKNINYKLFIALLVMGLCPTIYTTLRVFWLGELPGEWSFSIAGQLSWVNLLYEVLNEAIILPLFFFMGKSIIDKKDISNKSLQAAIIISQSSISFSFPFLFSKKSFLYLFKFS